jgi:uncharacterized membrane protein
MFLLRIIPTVVVAWGLYHILWMAHYSTFATDARAILETGRFSVPLLNNGKWIISIGDIITAFTVITGFVEVMKSSNLRRAQTLDHIIAVVIFGGILVEFLYLPAAQTSVFFFILLAIFLDVTVSYVIGIRAARLVERPS